MRRSHKHMALSLLLVGVALPGQGLAWPAGGVFVAPLPNASQLEPQLILGSAGSILTYWSDNRWLDLYKDLYGQLLTPAGLVAHGWPDTGLMVARAFNSQRSTAVGLAHPDGSFIVGFADFRNAVPSGTGIDTYLTRVLPDGQIDPAWPRHGFQAVSRKGDDTAALMVWVGPDTLVTGHKLAQTSGLTRALLQLVAITPSGPELPWGPAGIVYHWRPNEMLSTLSLVPDGEGGLFVLFDEVLASSSVGFQADLYLMRIDRDGQPAAGWESGARPVSLAPGPQETGVLVSDGAGGLYAAWADARSGSGLPFPDYIHYEDVRLLRLTREGAPAPGWPMEGLVVSDAPEWQYLPALLPDGNGGVYVSFDDHSVGSIGLTRVNGDGTFAPGWAKNGIPVSNLLVYASESKLVLDGTGGVFVLFDNVSEGNIYLQHVQPWGAVDPLWPATAHRVGSATNEGEIVPDGAGGCYVGFTKQLVPFGSPLVAVARYSVEGPVPVKLAEATVESEAGRVLLLWHGAEGVASELTVQRRAEGMETWRVLGTPTARGGGTLEYEDVTVEPGGRYRYRLVRGAEVMSTEERVEVPAAVLFALNGAHPNPALSRELSVTFTLTGSGAVRLEVLDLAGRHEHVRTLSGLGAGRHVVSLAEARLAPGVHWLRLSEGARVAHARVVVVR